MRTLLILSVLFSLSACQTPEGRTTEALQVPVDSLTKEGSMTCDSVNLDREMQIAMVNKLLKSESYTLVEANKVLCLSVQVKSDDIELGEAYNELIFNLLEKNPEFSIEALAKSGIDPGPIKKELENPIHDGIDLKSILNKLKAGSSYPEVRMEIIKSVETALSKSS